jgi:hypothetical protein
VSILLLLLLQGGAVTVGDTLWIERAIPPVGSAIIRPQPWNVGAIGQQLGPAEVRAGSSGTMVRYALVLWYPGEHTLTMPGPVLVKRDGSSDTLAASSVRIRVTSVLPSGARRTAIPPKPARNPVPLADRSFVPLVALTLGVLLAWAVAALLWRRRGPLPPVPPSRPPAQSFHDPAALTRWADAGEHRAALDGWGWILARRLAESADLEEVARIQRVLDDIADSVFSPKGPAYFAELCRRAETAATA